jgi:hypothetical protein
MILKSLRHPSPAAVISTIALVLAATGGASGATRLVGHLVSGGQIAPHSVSNRDIAPGAIRSADIARGAVHTSQIAKGAIVTSQIGSGQIRTTNIANGAVTTNQLAPGAVTASRLGHGQVGTTDLADGAVTTDKLDLQAVTTDRIADGAVTQGQLASGAVGSAQITSGAVGTDALARASVTPSRIAPLGPTHFVGAHGEPTFIGNADNANSDSRFPTDGGDPSAGYYVDQLGLVHLTGKVDPSTDNANPNQVFDLPPSLGPSHRLQFATVLPGSGFNFVDLGEVIVFPGGGISAFSPETPLDGITFRPGQ